MSAKKLQMSQYLSISQRKLFVLCEIVVKCIFVAFLDCELDTLIFP